MEITTPRLILREIVADDWPAVLAYQSDPRYYRYYAWTERTDADVREFTAMLTGMRDKHDPRREFQLAITLAGDPTLIGNCGIRRKPENEWEADIGYELHHEYWGRGYATEAITAMVEFGFRELGLHRVSALCNAENERSWRVMERIGMKREGLLRETNSFKGRWWDALVYGVLREEWETKEK